MFTPEVHSRDVLEHGATRLVLGAIQTSDERVGTAGVGVPY